MTATGTNPIWGGSYQLILISPQPRYADTLPVVKTRLQLSARKKTLPASFYSGIPSPTSPLPRPIVTSAAALSASASAVAGSHASVPRASPANALSMTLDIVRHEGIRGLYRGLSASYLGVSEGVIQWVLYEVSRTIQPRASAGSHFLGTGDRSLTHDSAIQTHWQDDLPSPR